MNVITIQDVNDGGIIAVTKDYKTALDYLFKWGYIDLEETDYFNSNQCLSEIYNTDDVYNEMLSWDIRTFNYAWADYYYMEVCLVIGMEDYEVTNENN